MDRNTAAALGQNLSNAFSDIGQIFDPRVRALGDQQRLTVEGLRLRNTGQGIENQYAPQVFGSQIGLNNARAATEGTQQGLYKSQTGFQDIQNQGLGDLYKLNSPAQTSLTPTQQKIASAASTYGVDPNVALSIVGQESGFNANTTPGTSSASGLFQFLDADRKQYGVPANASEDQQIDAGMRKMQENYKAAEKALGRKPTAGEAYAVYYQGIGAGPKILQNPDASFRDTLSQFGPGYADKVITANPWLADVKINRDFINWSEQKMGKQGFTSQPQPIDMNRAAILSSVAGGGGDPQQLTNALNTARAAQIFYNPNSTPDAIRVAQAATGTATPGFNTITGQTAQEIATGAPKLENERAIAAGKTIADLFGGGSTTRGDGSMLRVPKTSPSSFSDMNKVNEEAQAASFRTFGVPVDEEGAPTEDPYAATRRAWSQSYSNARQTMSPIEAEAAANVHHFGTPQPTINSEDTFRFGFGKDPSIPAITNTEPLKPSSVFGVDPAQSAAIIESIPGLFGLPSTQQPNTAASTVAPVTGVEQPAQSAQNNPPPMIARPEQMNRASDQFKRREGSGEEKARLEKQKEIATLETEINETLNTLKTGSVRTSGAGMMSGGMGGAFTPPAQSVALSNDAYNMTIDRLKKMESKLEKLRGGSDQSGQSGAVDLESRLSKYN
jgi:hypothetical protein